MRVRLRHWPAQSDFYKSTDRVAAFVGGLAYGKTKGACDWILTGAAEYPKARHFIFSNTYAQLRSGTLASFYEACENWGIEYVDRVHTYKEILLPKLGATIEVRSVDKPIKFKSLEFSRCWIDEAQYYPREAYELILGRLRGTDTQRKYHPGMPEQLRITANPPHSLTHWLAQGCTIPNPETGVPPIAYYTASTYDNPLLSRAYIESLEAQFDEDLREIELGGKFGTIGTGKVWRKFDRGRHVLSPQQVAERGLPALAYDEYAPLCITVDWNIDPLSWVLFQWRENVLVDGHQQTMMYVIDEIRIRHSMIEHGVKEFLNREDAVRVAMRNGITLYGDPAGNQGNRQTGVSDWASLKTELERHGFRGESRVPDAPPRIRDRYNAGNRMLINPKGEIGVVIHKRCTYLPQDLEAMVYKPGTSIVDEKKRLSDGATATHLGDAWSYAIAYEFPIVRPGKPPVVAVR